MNIPNIELAHGTAVATSIPQIGFGTFKIPPADTQRAVEQALELGYRHIDTAAAYMNEEGVGAALAATGMRDQVFVTTKLRNFEQGYDSALRAFEASCEKLGGAVDLYLVHWPCPTQNRYADTWRAFARLLDEGAVRAVGVSNFLPEHIERIVADTGVTPAVNQFESHPSFWQPELTAWCDNHNIAVEAYSPLGRGADLDAPAVRSVAERLGATPAQVILAWHIQQGRAVIPKSKSPERMRENLAAATLQLTAADLAAIDALNRPDGRISGDPAVYAQPQSPEDMRARGNL